MSVATGSTRRREKADLTLPPPSGLDRLIGGSDDEGSSIMHSDYEIFTFRLPCAVPVKSLDGMVLNMDDLEKSGKIQANGKEYKIVSGHPSENESFRLLVPESKEESSKKKKNDSDSDDDEESSSDEEGAKAAKPQYLKVLDTPFGGHFNILLSTEPLTEQKIAPTAEKAPKPAEGVMMKHAYEHVPQRTGLKRRWMPMGAKAKPSEPSPAAAAVKASSSNVDEEEPNAKKMKVETPKSAKKEKKHKKEGKKSKKEKKESEKKKKE
jgi:hypothetical protein